MFYLKKCKILIFLVLALVVIGITASFSSKTDFPNYITLAAPRDLAPGEKDPYYISSVAEVWEPLIGVDDDGKIVGVLATSWSHDADYKVWTFQLRKGVTFQDGTPFNAEAVVKNVERWMNMKSKPSPFYSFNVNVMYPGLLRAKAIGDYEVQLYFKDPSPMLIDKMMRFPSAIFSPKCFDVKTGNFKGIAKGTGPFKIVERKANQYVLLERYDDYYGEKAKSKFIVLRSIPNASTRYSALKSGEIQGVLDLGALTPALMLDLLKDKNFSSTTNYNTINHHIIINQTQWPFNDPRMIQAINLMIDREAIVNNYFNGQAKPTSNILNSLSPYALDLPLLHDEAKAKALAKEVVGDKRVEASFIIPQYGVDRYSYQEVTEYLQSAFKKLNVDVNIRILDGAAHKKMLSAGNYNFSIGTQGLPSYDPSSILEIYMSSKGNSNKLYHIGYKNAEADKLIGELKKTVDINKRRELYNKLQMIAYEYPPTIPLASDYTALVYNNKLTGYKASTYGLTLRNVQWKEDAK